MSHFHTSPPQPLPPRSLPHPSSCLHPIQRVQTALTLPGFAMAGWADTTQDDKHPASWGLAQVPHTGKQGRQEVAGQAGRWMALRI